MSVAFNLDSDISALIIILFAPLPSTTQEHSGAQPQVPDPS